MGHPLEEEGPGAFPPSLEAVYEGGIEEAIEEDEEDQGPEEAQGVGPAIGHEDAPEGHLLAVGPLVKEAVRREPVGPVEGEAREEEGHELAHLPHLPKRPGHPEVHQAYGHGDGEDEEANRRPRP